jgi:hypothetical protein
MEMRKNEFKQIKEMGQVITFKKKGNFIDDISEIYDFLYYDCYSVPDVSINGELRYSTNIAWIRRSIDINLVSIKSYNFEYIDNIKTLEIKYLNGDIIKLFAD